MTSSDHSQASWETIPIGEELPVVTYTLTQTAIDNYRQLVGNPSASYPTVAARHPAQCFQERYRGIMRVPNLGYDSEYYNPPKAGGTITVSAKVVEKYIRRGIRYMVIEAKAVDEEGRLVQIDRLRAMPKKYSEPAFEAVGKKWESNV